MVQSGRRRKKGRVGKSAANLAVPAMPQSDFQVTIDIHIGGIEFLEASSKLDDANGLAGGDAGPLGAIRYELTSWANKAKALEWFKAGCDQEHSAEMWFHAILSKEQRKEVHTICSTSYPSLKSVSRGSGDKRQIGIVHSSNTKWDMSTLSDEDEFKASALLSHLRGQGQSISVDEVRGLIASGDLTAELQATLDQVVMSQKNLDALLAAVKSNDAEAVKSILVSAPGAASVPHRSTGELPLHVAASLGSVSVMAMLVEAGASPEQEDGKSHTALQVARAAEQCDAEGWLLQQGVNDPDAPQELTEAPNLAALDTAAPAVELPNGEKEVLLTEGASASQNPARKLPVAAEQTELQAEDVCVKDAEASITSGKDEAWVDGADGPLQRAADVGSVMVPPQPDAAESAPINITRDFDAAVLGGDAIAEVQRHAEASQGAKSGSAAVGSSGGDGMSTEAATQAEPTEADPKVHRGTEIQPASPRPARSDDDDRQYHMSLEQDEENGLDVLVEWAGACSNKVTDWCQRYPAAVAAVGTALAVAGAVAVKLASSSRRY